MNSPQNTVSNPTNPTISNPTPNNHPHKWYQTKRDKPLLRNDYNPTNYMSWNYLMKLWSSCYREWWRSDMRLRRILRSWDKLMRPFLSWIKSCMRSSINWRSRLRSMKKGRLKRRKLYKIYKPNWTKLKIANSTKYRN